MKKLLLTFSFSLSALFLLAQTPFVPGNLVVLRSGSGTAVSEAVTVPISIVEYSKTGSQVQVIDVPSSGTSKLVLANNNPATREGSLNLSVYNDYVSFTGYNATFGVSNIQNTSGTSSGYFRGVGRFDAAGNFSVKTTSNMPGGSGGGGSYVRSAIQVDENRAWVVGNSNFLRYLNMSTGSSSSTWSTSTYPNLSNNSDIGIFNNNIYFSSAGTASGLYVVNTSNNRFPTTTTEAMPALVSLPGLGVEPNGFVFFDTNEDALPDLLYIADESATIGLQKYYYDGTNWIAKGTVQAPEAVTNKSLRGVTGVYDNGAYVIYANTGSSILSFTDTASPDAATSANAQILATADANYVFRGISFTPGTKKPSPRPETYAQRIQANTSLIGTIIANDTYRKYPGLEETHLKYKNPSGKDMTLFFLTVDLANPNIKVEAGMRDGGTAFATQYVRNQIPFKNTANPDYKVLAATNGDYWHQSTPGLPPGTPLGMVWMNGTMIKDMPNPADSTYYFMSILKDQTAVIGALADYTSTLKAQINYALGGRFYLVQKSDEFLPTNTSDTGENPRTTAGTLNPTKLVYTVIDGRRDGHSFGFSLTDVAKMYRALEVTDALNMDGGGSTTLVTKNTDDTYSVANIPSNDGMVERSVANSWMILGKKEQVTPVNLTSFTGVNDGNRIKLNWTTASEKNNSHFEIYRSDNNEFQLPMATVSGAGDSQKMNFYTYVDDNPLKGINYYQLNQVDFDGQSERSKIIAVNTEIAGEKFVLYKSGNQLQADVYSQHNTEATLKITDVSGRVISETSVMLEKGLNSIQLKSPAATGIYIATLQRDGKSQSLKFGW